MRTLRILLASVLTCLSLYIGQAVSIVHAYSSSDLIDLTVVKAYAMPEKSGNQITEKGDLRIRYDMYLKPDAPGYDQHYVYVMDETSAAYKAGYPGKIDRKTGEPLDPAGYENWLANLPKAWRNTPFLCAFMYINADESREAIKHRASYMLKEAYVWWTAGADSKVIYPLVKGATVNANPKTNSPDALLTGLSACDSFSSDMIINGDLVIELGWGLQMVQAGDPIDVGSPAIDRDERFSYNGYTGIDRTNPANADGVLNTLEIWLNVGGTSVAIGTFSGSGNSWNDRDYENIGTVTGGSKQTFTGVSVDVLTNDIIGYYGVSTRIEYTSLTGAGLGSALGNKFGGGSATYTIYNGCTMSLYATGETAGGETPAYIPKIWFLW